MKLADGVDLLPGFAFKSAGFTNNKEDIPLVKGENVGQGRILWNIAKRWPVAKGGHFEKYALQEGDVVLAMDRPWVPAGLKWAYIREEDPAALLVQRVARLRAKDGRLDQGFLRFIIGSPGFEDFVRPITTGVNVPHLSGPQILGYELAVPPLGVQRRIANILAAYDALIDNNLRRIQVLEEMVGAAYREWFTPHRPDGGLAGSAPTRTGRLSDLARLERDGVRPSDFPNEEFEHFSIPAFDAGQFPWIEKGATILSNKHFIDTSCVLVSKLNPRIRRVWLPQPNAEYRSIGSTEFLVLKPVGVATREYLYAHFSSNLFARQFANLAIGTSTSHQRVNPETLLAMPCTIPDEGLIDAFSRTVRPMLHLVNTLRYQVGSLKRARDFLLPRLMSGRLALNETEASA